MARAVPGSPSNSPEPGPSPAKRQRDGVDVVQTVPTRAPAQIDGSSCAWETSRQRQDPGDGGDLVQAVNVRHFEPGDVTEREAEMGRLRRWLGGAEHVHSRRLAIVGQSIAAANFTSRLKYSCATCTTWDAALCYGE